MYSITSKLIIKIHKRFTIEKINNNLKFFIKKLNLKRKINNKFVGLSKMDISKNFKDLSRSLFKKLKINIIKNEDANKSILPREIENRIGYERKKSIIYIFFILYFFNEL